MSPTVLKAKKAYFEDAYDDAVLSPEDEIKARVITVKQVLKLNVFSLDKALELYGVSERDFNRFAI